ncbi:MULTISPECIES: efflux RND transporter periplasmic adaptor subunit [Hydrotalea]|uniref:efflux RND transporter periplasmic adaptor subunit n=1 Tax=Hydrotalea TaxID=1004300 RepID=UPI000A751D5D|nr:MULTISPECIES: efflux RND transporter periplasmic adaptor subunit [Hydrotalea]
MSGKKNKILIIIMAVIALLAAVALLYFKFLHPKNAIHTQHSGMADMGNMNMPAKEEKVLYTCSMHPQIIREQPGNCPICGMRLVKKENESKKIHDMSLHTLLLPTNSYAVSSIPATTLLKSKEPIEINALGYTAYNTKEVGAISARISGRIEKLYIRYRYQKISKGQKIMDIYSPELLTAQQNLLFLLKNDPSNTLLINAAKEKLLLLGFPGEQLQQVITTQQPLFTVSVYSNYSGHIHDALNSGMNNNAVPEAPAMNEATSITTQGLALKEGMYLQKGQTIFEVYNMDKVWVLLNIYPLDQPFIKVGNKVRIVPEARPDKDFRSFIYFIEPFFRPGSKTVTARVNVDNNVLQLPIGSQVRATIFSNPVNAEWLPREAVLSLGLEKVVFVKSGNGYKAQKIETGVTYKNLIQVTGGITPVDSVAANAQFLMDSESFIKVQGKD